MKGEMHQLCWWAEAACEHFHHLMDWRLLFYW